MPTRRCLHACLTIGASFLAAGPLAGQGSLTPSGAPAPIFKTLTEVEPRTPVQSLPAGAGAKHVISAAGAYYLTGDIRVGGGLDGISVEADNVTIDLGGSSLIGSGGSSRGVVLRGDGSGTLRVRLTNGRIVGFGTEAILKQSVGTDVRVSLDDLQIACGRGVTAAGARAVRVTIRGGESGLDIGGSAENCEVSGLTGNGELIGIRASTAVNCQVGSLTNSSGDVTGIRASSAVSCQVGSLTSSTGAATGIQTANAQGCVVSFVFGSTRATGISATGSISDCRVATMGLTTSGPTTGLSGVVVERSSVDSIGVPNNGVPTGIAADVVRGCRVSQFAGPSGTSVGIQARLVEGCDVSQNSATAEGASFGIAAAVVSNCSVASLLGNGTLVAVEAASVSATNVGTVTVLGSAGEAIGIKASGTVQHCRVNTVNSRGGLNATGIQAPEVVSCRVGGAQSLGGGQAVGILTPSGQPGAVRGCTVAGSVPEGIRLSESGLVADCHVDGGTATTGLVLGIRAAAGARIEGNSVRKFPTGVLATDSSSTLVARNIVAGATTPFSVGPAVKIGPVVSGPGALSTTSPWANFVE